MCDGHGGYGAVDLIFAKNSFDGLLGKGTNGERQVSGYGNFSSDTIDDTREPLMARTRQPISEYSPTAHGWRSRKSRGDILGRVRRTKTTSAG